MSAPLSIIIPTLNVANRIGPCLGTLGEAVMQGLIHEVIFADGQSEDAIEQIADEVGARLIPSEQGRGIQLATGAKAAKGQWLLFLHADTQLGPGWIGAVQDHIARHAGRAGYFRLRLDADGIMPRLVEAGADARSRLLALPYGDQGLLIERAHYTRIGGFEPVPLMEDVIMARRLGRSLRRLGADAITDAERYKRGGWVRRPLRNLGTLVRFLLGTPPERLVKRYEQR